MLTEAYLCPTCRQTYCAKCHCPIEKAGDSGHCQNKDCGLYTKPICNDCFMIDFSPYQPDIDYRVHIRPDYRDVGAFWRRFRYVRRRTAVCQFVAILFCSLLIAEFAIMALSDMLKHDWASLRESGSVLGILWVIFLLGAWILFESSWTALWFAGWFRKPMIDFDAICPSCEERLANGPTIRMTQYEFVRCTDPGRCKRGSHPNS